MSVDAEEKTDFEKQHYGDARLAVIEIFSTVIR